MSNVIELNIAEIDTVVGGAGGIQTATVQQASAMYRPTNTLLVVPNKTFAASSYSVGGYDLSALQAQMEARR